MKKKSMQKIVTLLLILVAMLPVSVTRAMTAQYTYPAGSAASLNITQDTFDTIIGPSMRISDAAVLTTPCTPTNSRSSSVVVCTDKTHSFVLRSQIVQTHAKTDGNNRSALSQRDLASTAGYKARLAALGQLKASYADVNYPVTALSSQYYDRVLRQNGSTFFSLKWLSAEYGYTETVDLVLNEKPFPQATWTQQVGPYSNQYDIRYDLLDDTMSAVADNFDMNIAML
jgi:hypothetical protein